MKIIQKIINLVFLLPIVLIAEVPWHTVSFGMSNNANSATFHMEKFYYGIDASRMSFDGSISSNEFVRVGGYEAYNPELDAYVWQDVVYAWISQNANVSISSWLLTPKFGKRFKLKSSNKIQSFADIQGYLTIPLLDIKIKAKDDEDPENIVNTSDVEKFEDIIDNVLDFSGFKLSYGITYQVNDQVSFSTSFGYNHYLTNFNHKEESDNGDQITAVSLDTNTGYTFTAFTINFTF